MLKKCLLYNLKTSALHGNNFDSVQCNAHCTEMSHQSYKTIQSFTVKIAYIYTDVLASSTRESPHAYRLLFYLHLHFIHIWSEVTWICRPARQDMLGFTPPVHSSGIRSESSIHTTFGNRTAVRFCDGAPIYRHRPQSALRSPIRSGVESLVVILTFLQSLDCFAVKIYQETNNRGSVWCHLSRSPGVTTFGMDMDEVEEAHRRLQTGPRVESKHLASSLCWSCSSASLWPLSSSSSCPLLETRFKKKKKVLDLHTWKYNNQHMHAVK